MCSWKFTWKFLFILQLKSTQLQISSHLIDHFVTQDLLELLELNEEVECKIIARWFIEIRIKI